MNKHSIITIIAIIVIIIPFAHAGLTTHPKNPPIHHDTCQVNKC